MACVPLVHRGRPHCCCLVFGSSSLGVSLELVCLAKQLICGLSLASRVETGADCRLFPAVSGIAFDRLCASSAILGIVLPCLFSWMVCGVVKYTPIPARPSAHT